MFRYLKLPLSVPLLGVFVLLTARAEAAIRFTPKSAMLNTGQVTEPHPASGDVSLPMPGGLSMTLRPVCLPASGYLDATEVQHGVRVGPGDEAPGGMADRGQYTEQIHTLSLSAPFELENIPPAWGEDVVRWITEEPACAADPASGLKPYIYFLGKYEVSRAQWRAVMTPGDENPPFAFEENDYLPATRVSWFDVLEFTRRYSEWLMQRHPEYLPVFPQENRSSFLRLPSEAEWEYAARGGHKVSPAERGRTTLHPIPEGADYRDYIVSMLYDATLGGPAPIGSRRPNPLGMYDMLGNCSEMIFSPFQLVAGGRLIGGYGGFVIKGGSWRATSAEELHPGHRLEAAYYVDGKAQARDDMGFRVILGSILTPKERRDRLYQEWKNRSAPHAAHAAPGDDVRPALRAMADAIDNPDLKKRLEQAEAAASLYHEKVNENEERMIRETLMGALFSLETIANYGSRCYQLVCLMETYDTLAGTREHEEEIRRMKKEIRGFTEGIQSALFYYLAMTREACRFNPERLVPQLEKVMLQFAHDDGFSRSMQRRATALRKHVERKSASPLEEGEALADILPDWLVKKIHPYW